MKTKSIISILVTLFFFVNVPDLSAADIAFTRLRIANRNVLLNYVVIKYQKKDIVEAVKRGIEVRVVYNIEVVKKTILGLFEDRIISKSIHRSVKYDFFKRAYLVKMRSKVAILHNENAMLDALFTVREINLGSAAKISKKGHLLRVKAEVTSIKLYFPMNYIFKYIIGIWDFNTGWKAGPSLQDLR